MDPKFLKPFLTDYGTLMLVQQGPLTIRFVHESGMAPEEKLMDEITEWCATTKCGRRTAYDMFQFKNKQEVLLFTLRWR